MAADDRKLLYWVERLFDLPQDLVAEAVARVREMRIGTLTAELVDQSTADAAVASYLLVRGLDILRPHIPETKLAKKLRDDHDVWSAWTELRTAAMLIEQAPAGTSVEMDPGRSGGAQPDLRVVVPEDPSAQSIEIKAVGLSDDEVAFCRRVAPSLSKFAPPDGFVTVHSRLDHAAPRATREQIRAQRDGARKRIRSVLPSWPTGVGGASIVAHGVDADYGRRVSLRVRDAVRQLPATEECWVAIYWTNGASMSAVASAIDWRHIPGHVVGIVLVGVGTVFPDHRLHGYKMTIPRGADPSPGPIDFASVDESHGAQELGRLVHGVFQESSGVRATLVRVGSTQTGRRTLVLRNGTRRLVPFNLLLDRDLLQARLDLGGRQSA